MRVRMKKVFTADCFILMLPARSEECLDADPALLFAFRRLVLTHQQQLPDVFGQEQVCDFILGADNPANTSLFQAAKVSLNKLYSVSPSAKVDGGKDNSGTSSSPKPPSGSIHQDMLREMMRLHKYVQR